MAGVDEQVDPADAFEPGRLTCGKARDKLGIFGRREAQRSIFLQHEPDVGSGIDP